MNTPESGLLRCHASANGGSWTRRDAAHLLWRTQHGASEADLGRAHTDGLTQTLDRLLSPQDELPEFMANDRALRRLAEDSGNIEDLKAWWAHRLLASANPLLEKMTLFWHNHFATSQAKVRSTALMAAQNDLFRRHALGSFRQLLHEMARDVAMLIWLDGNANRNRHPNENFARELMELFSLGVGHYSEKDIQEAARAFTGWHVREGRFWFNQLQHDRGVKTVLGRAGNLDGDDVVEACLHQEAAPRFLAGKLLSFFVLPEPPKQAVDELAASIRANDYSMRPVLEQLFSSSLFYSSQARHSLIKSPADLVLGTLRTLDVQANLPAAARCMAELGQDLFRPPTVEGWKGGRLWINSATMLARINFAADLVEDGELGSIGNPAQVAQKYGWTQPHQAVDYYIELLLARDLPDARTMIEDYLEQSTGQLNDRLQGVIHLVMTLPEFQLM